MSTAALTTSPKVSFEVERLERLERLDAAARRATWNATRGPMHLRAGRFDLSAPIEPKASVAPAHDQSSKSG